MKATSIRLSLFRNFILVILLLSGSILLTTYFNSNRTIKNLSGLIITQTLNHIEAQLQYFFFPVVDELLLARSWGKSNLLQIQAPEQMDKIFIPLIQQHPQISSLLIANEKGEEYMLLRTGTVWRTRETRKEEWGEKTRWRTWTKKKINNAEVSFKNLDYDPRTRPWYKAAIAQYKTVMAKQTESNSKIEKKSLVQWTRPYRFYTTQEPGITTSVKFIADDGTEYVLAFDILLNDITEFTMNVKLPVSPNGKVVVLTSDGKIIGLPNNPEYRKIEERKKALLKHPQELHFKLKKKTETAFLENPGKSIRFYGNLTNPWWGQLRNFPLSNTQYLKLVMVVPESDLLADIYQKRQWILFITFFVLLGSILQVFFLARRFSNPIEHLVRESDRLSRGDLAKAIKVSSQILEVQRLTAAQEQMRSSLQSLFKMEQDLQIAREVQQNTFPKTLPVLPGFELDAWNEPADETGGDTYDVIGFKHHMGNETNYITADEANRAILLLADATGHGVGPAISVTQLRAMLRIAVRLTPDISTYAENINKQLSEDLLGGRFITAWFGLLDTSTHTITSFSAGQGPLIYYSASKDSFEIKEADTFPLGIVPHMRYSNPQPIPLEPGDLFVVLSDGIFEAVAPDNSQFGVTRVQEIISVHKEKTAKEILDIIRVELEKFTQKLPATDDRTGIIIKRI